MIHLGAHIKTIILTTNLRMMQNYVNLCLAEEQSALPVAAIILPACDVSRSA